MYGVLRGVILHIVAVHVPAPVGAGVAIGGIGEGDDQRSASRGDVCGERSGYGPLFAAEGGGGGRGGAVGADEDVVNIHIE